MDDLEKLFEKEVKEFGQAFGHEAAYALDVVACKLLSSQEHKHKKEMEELIEEMDNKQIFEYPEIVKYPKMQKISCEQAFIAGQLNMKMRLYDLKSKYLTKGKE